MPHPITTRLKHSWAVLSGKISLPAQTEGLEFMTQLNTALAAIAVLSAGADRLIAVSQNNADALAKAQSDLTDANASVVAALQPIIDKVNAAAPAPAEDDTGADGTGAPVTDPAAATVTVTA